MWISDFIYFNFDDVAIIFLYDSGDLWIHFITFRRKSLVEKCAFLCSVWFMVIFAVKFVFWPLKFNGR